MLTTIITILHIAISIILVLIVLLQQGKGADMGATFGGSSNTLFGAAGADTFLTKLTTLLAVGFMATSVTLAVTGKQAPTATGGRLFQNVPSESAPAAEAPKAASPVGSNAPSAEKTSDQSGASPADNGVVNQAAPSAGADAAKAASDAPAGTSN